MAQAVAQQGQQMAQAVAQMGAQIGDHGQAVVDATRKARKVTLERGRNGELTGATVGDED